MMHGDRRSPARAALALCVALCGSALPAGPRARAQDPQPAPAQPSRPSTQPSLASSLSGQAKTDYEAGRVLFADGDHAGAFMKFRQAFALAGDPRLLWNMAVCEKNRRQYASVLTLLERYKREGGAQFSAQHRQEVDDIVEMVRMLISTVHVEVAEAGASVYVDDRLVGTTPLSDPLLVDLGKRRLRVTKPGFVEQSLVQDFTGGSSLTFRFSLKREPSEAQLRISGHGMIYVDDKHVGDGSWSGTVAAGQHTLRVTAAGMVPYEREVVLGAGQTRSFDITLSAAGGGVPTAVWIGAAAVAASGLAVGGYFLFRSDTPQHLPAGTLGNVRL